MSDAEATGGFAPETPILTEAGYRPIGELAAGDRAVSGEGVLREITALESATVACVAVRTAIRPPVVLAADAIIYSASPTIVTQLDSPDYGKEIYGRGARTPARAAAGTRWLMSRGFPFDLPVPELPEDNGKFLLELAAWAALGPGLVSTAEDNLEIGVPCGRHEAFRARYEAWMGDARLTENVAWIRLAEEPTAFLLANCVDSAGKPFLPAWLLALSSELRAAVTIAALAAAGNRLRPGLPLLSGTLPLLCLIADLAADDFPAWLPLRPAVLPRTGFATGRDYILRDTPPDAYYLSNAAGDCLTPIVAVEDAGTHPAIRLALDAGHTCIVSGGLVAACG